MTKPKIKATPHKIGRPTKFTLEVRERILSAIRAGNYIDTAAQSAGICKDTFYSWMTKGEARGAPREYSDFTDAVKKARAQAQVDALAIIQLAANSGNWRAAAWYLEKSFPDRYGPTRTETPVAAEDPIETSAAVIDLLDEKIKLMTERSKAIIETYGTQSPVEIETDTSPIEIQPTAASADRIAEILANVPISAPIVVEETIQLAPTPPRRRMPAPIIRPRTPRHGPSSLYFRNT